MKSQGIALPLVFLLILVISLAAVQSAKIVFIFTGGNLSHKIFVWPFVIALAEHGHHVTFYSSSPKTLHTHPNVTDVAPAALVQATANIYGYDRFQRRADGLDAFNIDLYKAATLGMCRSVMNSDDPDLVKMVENGDYDLAIVNSIFGECGVLLAQHHGWKYIYFSANTIVASFHHVYGVPWLADHIPEMTTKMSYPMGFYDRMWNLYSYYEIGVYDDDFEDTMQNLMKSRFGVTTVPKFADMEQNASLVFYNSHHALDFTRALPPMFIPVGGMTCWSEISTLDKKVQEFMDDAEEGVILISFGSTVLPNTMSEHFLTMFFAMMRKFSPVRFIWRWNGTMPDSAPKNLMALEWLPQREILNHPKTRALMSHCGLNSIIEATCYGVPVLAIPLYGDQDANAYRLEAHEVGVKLELRGITQTKMDEAVDKILSNYKYKENMMTRSRILKDQPLNPVESAVFWTEFVLRHNDTSSFKLMGLEQPLYVRHMLDVYLFLLFVLIIVPLIVMYLVLVLIRKVIFKL